MKKDFEKLFKQKGLYQEQWEVKDRYNNTKLVNSETIKDVIIKNPYLLDEDVEKIKDRIEKSKPEDIKTFVRFIARFLVFE
jgi:hypothetical protein